MIRAVRSELQLAAVEEDIFRGECLVGRVAALAAISSARGRALQAREAQRVLTSLAGVLEPLYALSNDLRHAGTHDDAPAPHPRAIALVAAARP